MKHVLVIFLVSMISFLPQAFAQSNQRTLIDVSAVQIPTGEIAGPQAGAVEALTATVVDAANSREAMELILNHLSPDQQSNTVIVSEDGEVLKTLSRIYGHSARGAIPTPAFLPLGQLAENNRLLNSVSGSPLARIWGQARAWQHSANVPLSSLRPLGDGLKERIEFMASPKRRVDAVYYAVMTGLRTYGWLFVRGDSVSAAHFSATLGQVSNLAYFQTLSVIYSTVPNKFADLTAWTTTLMRKAARRDITVPANQAWNLAGNLVTQTAMNATSLLLGALDPHNPFFTKMNMETILLNSGVGTSTDFFVQKIYAKLGQLKVERQSDLEMTDFLLRRIGMVAGIVTMSLAPTPKLQKLDHFAWVIQGLEVVGWIALELKFESVVNFAENSKLLKNYAEIEHGLARVPKILQQKFLVPEPCLSFLSIHTDK